MTNDQCPEVFPLGHWCLVIGHLLWRTTMANQLSRRTVLRGLGTVVGLPVLDAMMPRSLRAATASPKTVAPKRMAFVYVPNGCHMEGWTPEKFGTDYDLTPILQ